MTTQYSLQNFSAAQKANLESGLSLTNTLFGSLERLAYLNLNTARSLLEENTTNARMLGSADGLPESLSLQASWQQPVMEKSMAYWRNVYDIGVQTQDEVSKLMESQMAELVNSVTAALDQAAKSGPSGSATTVAALKSAVVAFHSAFDSLSKTAKQVTELTEANVAAASDATTKAISAQGQSQASATKGAPRKAA